MTRLERYKRGLAITKRLSELKEIHSWTPEEFFVVLSLLDEVVPMSMHNIG
jgi:acyl-CoA oxidase